jgi:nascent polypeptide-associated complex subunit alpha
MVVSGMKVNPRQMERMMKQMGIQSKNIEAQEVVIKSQDKNIVIKNPVVTEVNMGGQVTFQIVGEVSEEKGEEYSEEDVKMVMEKTGASEQDAKKALKENEGDIAQAILSLS